MSEREMTKDELRAFVAELSGELAAARRELAEAAGQLAMVKGPGGIVWERDDLLARLAEVEAERDDARAEIANLSSLYEHAKAERDRLREERDKAHHEVQAIRDQHARILSWPTQDVARAKAVIMQAGAKLAREGHEIGRAVAEAVDTLERRGSQLEAEVDKLRPVVEAAREVDAWMGDERWQLGDAPNKALDALEQALAALDAGEDES